MDHIIPRAVCPELDNVIANLELMPLRANAAKNAKIGPRQVQKAEELRRARLLSKEGLAKGAGGILIVIFFFDAARFSFLQSRG